MSKHYDVLQDLLDIDFEYDIEEGEILARRYK